MVGCSWAAAAAIVDKLLCSKAGQGETALGCIRLGTAILITCAGCAALCWDLWSAVARFVPASSPPYRVLSSSRECLYYSFIVSWVSNLLFSFVYSVNAH